MDSLSVLGAFPFQNSAKRWGDWENGADGYLAGSSSQHWRLVAAD